MLSSALSRLKLLCRGKFGNVYIYCDPTDKYGTDTRSCRKRGFLLESNTRPSSLASSD